MVCYTSTIQVIGGRVATVLGLWRVSSLPGALANAQQMMARPWWSHALWDLVISPITESLMIIGIVELLGRWKFSAMTGITVATLLFGVLHAFTIPIWGIICIPLFFIDSVSYVYWRRVSFWTGLQVIILIHAFSNLPPSLSSLERDIRLRDRSAVSVTRDR
jgi:hypothetical protein